MSFQWDNWEVKAHSWFLSANKLWGVIKYDVPSLGEGCGELWSKGVLSVLSQWDVFSPLHFSREGISDERQRVNRSCPADCHRLWLSLRICRGAGRWPPPLLCCCLAAQGLFSPRKSEFCSRTALSHSLGFPWKMDFFSQLVQVWKL